MKHFLILFALVNSIVALSQEKGKLSRRYTSLDNYKKNYNKALTKKDSLNLIVIDSITFILIEEIETSNIKGKSVLYEYKDDTFLNIYKKIAFNHKNNSFSNRTQMKYWNQDINFYFSESIPKKTKRQFLKFAKTIVSEIDSLKVNEVKSVKNSNYIVYYSQDYEYEDRMSNSKESQYWMYWKHNCLIYKNAIKIKTDNLFNEKLRLQKMKIYFIESLGYFKYNTQLDCEHFFSGCYQKDVKLSKFDKEILKYHYSYGICKGTSIQDFEEQHLSAKKLLKETNITTRILHNY